MDTIEAVKAQMNLVMYAGRYTALKPAGKDRWKGLCPLHKESNPSFFVYADAQRWHCFGCNKGGDVLDLAQALEGWDFRTALEQLAQQAGVALPSMDAVTHARWQAVRQTQSALEAGAVYFQKLMHAARSPGMAYARSRGWQTGGDDGTRDTIRTARLGYYDANAGALRQALTSAGIDIRSPAAQALLRTPGPSLVYPFLQHGNVVYYTVRLINPPPGKAKAWNPPADLLGAKPLYANALYNPTTESVMVVEGQGDAVTLAQWGIPALATVGTGFSDALVEQLRTHTQVTIGVEKNAAGIKHAHELADALHPLTHLVHWPMDDANAWLQAGATADDLQKLLLTAPTHLDTLVDRIKGTGATSDEELKRVFRALNQLDSFQLARCKQAICTKLNLPARAFNAMLRAAQGTQPSTPGSEPGYCIVEGRICRKVNDVDGSLHFSPLCNFEAHIVRDCLSDDGELQHRTLTLTGRLADGSPLPPTRIPADQYNRMEWVLDAWGIRPLINVIPNAHEHLRYAIQELSADVVSDVEYAHLGWREIDGQPVYLTNSGAVGHPGIRANLPVDLQAYALPVEPAADPKKALTASLRFWDAGDLGVTVPLWALMYLAPLTERLRPSFTLWIYGTTGTMKSTLTALALCHYGSFSYDMPSTSWNSTEFALRRLAFLAKDAPLWIDDYTLQPTISGRMAQQKSVTNLLREWGNRSTRSAGRADGNLRAGNFPRGLVVTTAEVLPGDVSIRARMVTVHMHPKMVTGGAGSALTRAQTVDAPQYPSAMAAYLQWLANGWASLNTRLHELLTNNLQATRARLTRHQRTAMNTAMLCTGLDMGLRFALASGVIDQEGYEGRLTAGRDVLLANAEQQDSDINLEFDSVALYFSALDNLLTQGTCYLRSRQHPDAETMTRPQNRSANSMLLGWYDDACWYLLPNIAFQVVYQFYRLSGVVFPDTELGVKTKLQERGLIVQSNESRNTYRLRIKEERKRVLVVASQWDDGTNED